MAVFLICFLYITVISVEVLSTEPKIVGGHEAIRNQFPYQVSLKSSGQHICGGTIVNQRHVVTAGHCVVSAKGKLVSVKTLRIDVGTISISGRDGKSHSVQKISLPEGFSLNPIIKSDIAVLRIKGKFSFGLSVQPANLPQYAYKTGTTCVISGWGKVSFESSVLPTTLRYANVQIIDKATCQWASNSQVMASDMFCAGYLAGMIDACQGDSGGPLVCGNTTLTGVVSHGYECARPNYPGVYTDVYYHYKWISDVLKSSSTVIVPFVPLTFTIIIFNLCK